MSEGGDGSAFGYDVVVLGNAGLDTLVFYDGEIDLESEGQYSRNRMVVGHAGGYSSRGFARLDRRTVWLGGLGNDPAGRMVRDRLAAAGVGLEGVVIDPGGTPHSVNLMDPHGRRHAFYDGGGHMTMAAPFDLGGRLLEGVRLAHFQLANWTRHLLSVARDRGALVSVDLHDIPELDDAYRADYLAAADIVFASSANFDDPEWLAAALLARGRAQVVVVGAGADGAVLAHREKRAIEMLRQPPPSLDLPVEDTNGAGDGLAVGFLDGFVFDGLSFWDALRRGQIVAGWTCSQVGGESLITREQLAEFERALNRGHSSY